MSESQDDSVAELNSKEETVDHTELHNTEVPHVHAKENKSIYDARKKLGEALNTSRAPKEHPKSKTVDNDTQEEREENTVDASIKKAVDSNINVAGGDIHTGATSEQITAIVERVFTSLLGKGSDKKSGQKEDVESFSELDLFARARLLTVCFFEGMNVTDFDNVFEIIRIELFDDAYNEDELFERLYEHPRTIPGLDLIEVYDDEKSAKVYQFKELGSGKMLIELVKKEHSKLAFRFVTALVEVIKSYTFSPEIRVRAAYALAEIAEIDVRYVYKTAIKKMAESQDDRIRATVSYFFAYLLINPDQSNSSIQNYLYGVITDWADSSRWNLQWSAASVCEQLGIFSETEQTQIFAQNTLKKLSSVDNIRVANSVIHALVGWSLKQKPFAPFILIREWVEEGSGGHRARFNPYQVRCVVGIWSFWALVIRNSELLSKSVKNDFVQPLDIAKIAEDNQGTDRDLLPIMVAVGTRSFEFKMGNHFFSQLEKWIDVLPDNASLQAIIPVLLRRIYATLPPQSLHQRHLENRIVNVWLKSKNSALRSAAKSMLASN